MGASAIGGVVEAGEIDQAPKPLSKRKLKAKNKRRVQGTEYAIDQLQQMYGKLEAKTQKEMHSISLTTPNGNHRGSKTNVTGKPWILEIHSSKTSQT